jgi:hypothetical protein
VHGAHERIAVAAYERAVRFCGQFIQNTAR